MPDKSELLPDKIRLLPDNQKRLLVKIELVPDNGKAHSLSMAFRLSFGEKRLMPKASP